MYREEYQRLFALEDTLWWFLGMRRASTVLLDTFLRASCSERWILDAGCGTGGMLETLHRYGRTLGADASAQALSFAQQRDVAPLVRADVCRLPFAAESFDVVTSFDVIYHNDVPSDDTALLEMARVLRPRGLLLIRVPALNLFRGRHDVAVHTRHRYRRRDFEKKLELNGFVPEFVSYLNCFLLPLAILRRGVERVFSPGRRGSEVEPIAGWLNLALYRILATEAKWIRRRPLPLGLSLVAVARKASRHSALHVAAK
jgi:SAM-dependent methyltransferase